jgi:formate-dependent nitrite reductase cytochrome c552 subunit
MAFRLTLVLVILAFVVTLSARRSLLTAADGAAPPLETVAATMPLAADAPEDDPAYAYVGTKKCKMCHLTEHKSWAKTKMGKAMETLMPGKAAETKAKFKLGAHTDYTKDETCLKCHTTGYGKPGGYTIPDPGNRRAVRKAKDLEGVGCESCHGPGSAYVKIFEEIDKSRRPYAVEELHAAGLRKIEEATCLECHNDTAPTFDPQKPFDFEKAVKEDTHERKPLELRKE